GPAGVSGLGHLDLAGNLSEWVLDHYEEDFYTTAGACANCANLSLGLIDWRVMRGGSITLGAAHLRAASRDATNPRYRRYSTGVRCARDTPP
ncbi:MAG: formylglycine-generating enzyme family protein, partial [Myxococcota bacterium]